jgi:hypothetical protein
MKQMAPHRIQQPQVPNILRSVMRRSVRTRCTPSNWGSPSTATRHAAGRELVPCTGSWSDCTDVLG